ncbi:ABC transporter substrate-binding protein [Georgenia sp. Z1491]|uniref:ABC transporter substrate-binding protein n=1 Tax=Georgenia sp. Z1491 TaxID=3416707 RepID=UPI003CF9DCB2
MTRTMRRGPLGASLLVAGGLVLAACGGSPSPADSDGDGDESDTGDGAGTAAEVAAGWVSAIDQVGLPAALDQGFFEDAGLDVTVADPFASGVDMLNALETDQIQFAQVGAPFIGAHLSGADYVIVGNYTGSASTTGIDETMAVVARDGSGITEDVTSYQDKRIGVTVGSINHLYLLAALEDAGMTADDIEIVNTAAPDMAVALQTEGVDAVVIWDPWPFVIEGQVEGATVVQRGGGHIAFIGYIVAKRDFVEENPELVEEFLTARAESDQWMRENPADAAELSSRWLSSLDPEVAEQAMEFNIRQLDPRLSACNYAALDTAQATLAGLEATEDTFDVNDVFVPEHMLAVAEAHPDLFEDLDDIPESAVIGDGFTYDPDGDQCV